MGTSQRWAPVISIEPVFKSKVVETTRPNLYVKTRIELLGGMAEKEFGCDSSQAAKPDNLRRSMGKVILNVLLKRNRSFQGERDGLAYHVVSYCVLPLKLSLVHSQI